MDFFAKVKSHCATSIARAALFVKKYAPKNSYASARRVVDSAQKHIKRIPPRLALIFMVGFVIGAVVKSTLGDHIAVGFDDHLILPQANEYDINATEEQLLSQQMTAVPAAEEEATQNTVDDAPQQ